VLTDVKSGEYLAEEDTSLVRLAMASTTMTLVALVILEEADLSRKGSPSRMRRPPSRTPITATSVSCRAKF
jgi:D-alanyl-D-alanine carboxypeptidase